MLGAYTSCPCSLRYTLVLEIEVVFGRCSILEVFDSVKSQLPQLHLEADRAIGIAAFVWVSDQQFGSQLVGTQQKRSHALR